MVTKFTFRYFQKILQHAPNLQLLKPHLVVFGFFLTIMLPKAQSQVQNTANLKFENPILPRKAGPLVLDQWIDESLTGFPSPVDDFEIMSGPESHFHLGVVEPKAPQQSRTGPIPPIEVLERDSIKRPEHIEDSLSEITLPVPAYIWRHGCGPTALGMVVGYYDTLGYDDLIPGSANSQTSAVTQAIASGGDASNPYPSGSERHYEDYASPEDSYPNMLNDDYITKARVPHADDSLADYMDTSKSTRSNYYGWSWSSDMGPAFVDYVNQQNPAYAPGYQPYYSSNGTLTWLVLTSEIDAGRPMVFLVDTDANGQTDHFVTVMGYRTSPTLQYGVRDTWSTTVRWENFGSMAPGVPWGIWGGWSFHLDPLQITCSQIEEILESDCGAMQSFYDSTNGDEWGNWFTTTTPCSTPWTGVHTCWEPSVIDLFLSDEGISGTLPAEIGNFYALEQLKLNDNNLSGNIPDQLSNLRYTGVLDLSNNQLSGPIPEDLHGEFTINLSRNRLSGNIPTQWGYVEDLDLSRNQLSGAIPVEFMNGIEHALYNLDLGYNMLSVSNSAVAAWLDQVDPDWFLTQTVPPTDLQATPQSSTSIQLIWDPIAYQADGGHYQISFGTSSSGTGDLRNTVSKSEASYLFTGLEPDQTYYFKIRTYTPAHDAQKNNLWSIYSGTVSAKTFGQVTANFSGSPKTGEAPLIVTFTDQSSGNIDSWLWNFGDGSTSTQQNPSHTYDLAGNYTVSLMVSGPGGSDTETKANYIQVSEPRDLIKIYLPSIIR